MGFEFLVLVWVLSTLIFAARVDLVTFACPSAFVKALSALGAS
jgi:hypothetical protein